MAADARALVRRKDGEEDTLGGHHVEDFAADGGLGEPHAFGAAAEAVYEVGDAPADLGDGVAAAGERHDDVVVNLRDRRAVAAVTLGAGAIGVEDHAIGTGRFLGEPLEQGWAEVEAHARIVVNDAGDFVLEIGDAGGAVGGVTLRSDALVPVVVRGGGVFGFDGFEPGVFSWGLVEMAVNADVALWVRRVIGHGFMIAAARLEMAG